MSLKTELAERGVRLSELAKELGEAYGNLYTALQLEDQGREVHHRAVLARIEKVRAWLAQERAGEARTSAAVEAGADREALLRRVKNWRTPPGWTVSTDVELASGRHLRTGDVVTTRDGDETVRYRFLRAVFTPRGTWLDLYGGPGLKEAHRPRWRSLPPAALGMELAP